MKNQVFLSLAILVSVGTMGAMQVPASTAWNADQTRMITPQQTPATPRKVAPRIPSAVSVSQASPIKTTPKAVAVAAAAYRANACATGACPVQKPAMVRTGCAGGKCGRPQPVVKSAGCKGGRCPLVRK